MSVASGSHLGRIAVFGAQCDVESGALSPGLVGDMSVQNPAGVAQSGDRPEVLRPADTELGPEPVAGDPDGAPTRLDHMFGGPGLHHPEQSQCGAVAVE
jgi:hypothetical protein